MAMQELLVSRTALTAHVMQAPALVPARWRASLLSGLAASALAISTPLMAGALSPDCGNATGTAVFDAGSNALTCSGNQSPGISTFADNLFVTGLTGNITPSAGLHGIELFGSNSVTLQSTLSGFSIITTGPVAHGINADRQQGVMIEHQGNISATGPGSIGIRGRASQGEVSISSRGNITAGEAGAGIFANTTQGSITVLHNGDISGSSNSSGIQAIIDQSGNGAAISITSKGNITLDDFDASPIGRSAGITAIGFHDVSVTSAGNITTAGELRDGIYAYSNFGDITVVSSGDIAAQGSGAAGIRIDGGRVNNVKILDGTISAAGGSASVVLGGTMSFSNELENHGTIETRSRNGYAIISQSFSHTKIDNYGTITGNVDFGLGAAGPSTFNNLDGAAFNTGTYVNLSGFGGFGFLGTLTNSGTLSPGGPGRTSATQLIGNLVQGSSGVFAADINLLRDEHDFFQVEGTANLSGRIVPQLTGFYRAGLQQVYPLVVAAGVTNNGLTVADTALVDYSLLYPNSNDVVLSVRVNFDVPGLTPNQSSVLDYFGRGGSGGVAELQSTVAAILSAPDIATVAAITDQLFSNTASAAASKALTFSGALAAALRSCPVAEGPKAELRETSCLWARPTYRQFSQDKGTDRAKIDDDTSGISGGFQTAIGENVWVGLGFSVESSNSNIDGTTNVDGTWWQVGSVAKWSQGPWKLSGSFSGGQGDLETLRAINIPGFAAIASSGSDASFATGLARLAYSFGESGFYVTPMLNLGFNSISIDGFTESGAGALNLQLASESETIFSGGPAVEIGATVMAQGLTFRPYARFGVTFLSEDTFTTSGRFAAAPASVAPFTIQSRFDDVYADISAGVQWFSASGINLRLNYDGRIGESSEQHGIDAKLTLNY